jgi:hypothetical protein
MSALLQQVALISESKSVPMKDLMRVAAALQKQATRDLAPIWEISATVDAFEQLKDVPAGYWPMIVRDDIGFDAAGIHLDKDGQPFALISASSDLDTWSLTASHELGEMLVDPFGNRVVAGDSPKPDQERVEFLVEVCDPSEAAEFGYSVNGILVSDFYTPRYFDPVSAPGVRYSFTGEITDPRQVLRGGYLSWHDPISDHWWQLTWFEGAAPKFRDIGRFDVKAGSLRSQIDRLTTAATAKALAPGRAAARAAGLTSAVVEDSTSSKAAHWHSQIRVILSQSRQESAEASVAQIRQPRRAKNK